MDLNEAIGNTPLLLHAGQSKAFNFKLWPVVNAGPVEYVWADHALEKWLVHFLTAQYLSRKILGLHLSVAL